VRRYTNEFNDALLSKRGNDSWKCWNAKFSSGVDQCKQVDGLMNHQQIADNFKKHFSLLLLAQLFLIMQYTYEHTRPHTLVPHIYRSIASMLHW